jgi:hypothetical protein
MTWSRENILNILANPEGSTTINGNKYHNSMLVYRMLRSMFQRQELDEQTTGATKHNNGVGFNGLDAPILTDIVRSAERYNAQRPNAYGLSRGQAALVAKKQKKYVGQLEEIASIKTRSANA